MLLSDVMLHEWRTRLAKPAALASLLVFAGAVAYGVMHGRAERATHVQAIAAHETEVAAAMKTWLAAAKTLEDRGPTAEVPSWAASAMDVSFPTALPPAPLADFAIGQSDLLPRTGALSLWEPDVRLFARYEFEDPVALALGGFDLSKAIILLLPLLQIVLSFDVLSAERDGNRLAFLAAQGAPLRRLTWLRLAIRSAVALTATFAVALPALLLGGGASIEQRLPYFAMWAFAVLLYAACWLAIIAYVVSKNRRSDANVMALLLAWTASTLIVPASAAAVAEMAYPTPSRAAYLADARETEIQTELAESEITRGFVSDHPDMVIDEASEVPTYFRVAYLVTTAVDEATKHTLAAFEDSASRRERALRMLRYGSPAIVLHQVFNDLAGSSAARYRHYVSQARAFKARYAERAGPYIVAGRRLPLVEANSLPVFRFEDEPLQTRLTRHRGALAFLALVTALLLVLSDRGLRRIRVIEA